MGTAPDDLGPKHEGKGESLLDRISAKAVWSKEDKV